MVFHIVALERLKSVTRGDGETLTIRAIRSLRILRYYNCYCYCYNNKCKLYSIYDLKIFKQLYRTVTNFS